MPTPTLEEYLESIYKLAEKGPVRPTQLAEAMSVAAPTVTATLRRLEDRDLVSREGTAVVLTPTGRELAVDIVRRHRIAERFLVDTLGLEWDAAHEEACRLEHALSPRVLEALERYLENPEVCPHGHPIPSSEGVVAELHGRPLSELPVECSGTIVRVAEDDDEILAYLGSLGMYPDRQVKVLDAAPFEGPLTVEVQGVRTAIARDLAALVIVEQIEPEECAGT